MDKTFKIWTDLELVEVTDSTEDLIKAMRFKSDHILAKADQELFRAVADRLEELNYWYFKRRNL